MRLTALHFHLTTSLTSFHLFFEQEAAEVLGISYEEVMQAALIPVAFRLGRNWLVSSVSSA